MNKGQPVQIQILYVKSIIGILFHLVSIDLRLIHRSKHLVTLSTYN